MVPGTKDQQVSRLLQGCRSQGLALLPGPRAAHNAGPCRLFTVCVLGQGDGHWGPVLSHSGGINGLGQGWGERKQGERQGEWEEEAGSLLNQEPDVALHPRTLGLPPGPKAAA